MGRLAEDVELSLLVVVSFLGILILCFGHFNFLPVHLDVLPIGLIKTWGGQDAPLLFVCFSHAFIKVFFLLENGFGVLEHLIAIFSDGTDVFKSTREIADRTLLLELGDLGRIRLRNIT